MYALPHPVGHEVEVPPDGVVHRNCNIRLHIDVRHGQVVSGGADTSEMVGCDKRGTVAPPSNLPVVPLPFENLC